MITLFATPKNFTGIFKTIQLNALRSWRAISPDIQIIIFGDSEGSRESAEEIAGEYIPEVRSSSSGVPLLSDLFRQADKIARFPTIIFVNADIILPANLLENIYIVSQKFNRFLIVGHRWDMDLDKIIDFDDEKNCNLFWERVKTDSHKHACTGIDYFIYKRNQWGKIPDFIIGRPGYDNWLIWKARHNLIPVIDVSTEIRAVHQNHDFNFHNLTADPKIVPEPDGIMNQKLHQGRTLNLLDCNYHIENGKIYKNESKDYINRNLGKLPTIFPEFSSILILYKKIYRRYFL